MQTRHDHPVRLRLPLLHRRGIAWCRHATTTPSGFACHPSTGGELPGADTPRPPRQASPATPPQEGNCLVQTRHDHPVRLRLPPLHRRGMVYPHGLHDLMAHGGCSCSERYFRGMALPRYAASRHMGRSYRGFCFTMRAMLLFFPASMRRI